jgi:hypothetical protein
MKIVLMCQGPDSDLSSPLPGLAGKRLAMLAALASAAALGECFERQNVFPTFPGAKFPMREAKKLAAEAKPALKGRMVLMLGKKVAHAFGVDSPPFLIVDIDGFKAVQVPHPSPMNLYYNSTENVEQAKVFFAGLLAEKAEMEAAAQ